MPKLDASSASQESSQKSYAQTAFKAPAGATEILLVRHGASQVFVPGGPFPMLDGQGDPALSPEGHEQAKLVGERLAGEPATAAYVSTLQRTAQTASPFLDHSGLTASVKPDLREIFLGEWEGGLSRIKMTERTDPVAIKVFETGRWDHVPGAENFQDFSARCMKSLREIAAAHPDGKVVAFVHGGVIGAIATAIMAAEPRWMSVDNCSISHVVATENQFMLKSFNDTAHLGPTFT
ncbi:MAG: histidine phosphatase family protein [Acidimicrobiales bacterium]